WRTGKRAATARPARVLAGQPSGGPTDLPARGTDASGHRASARGAATVGQASRLSSLVGQASRLTFDCETGETPVLQPADLRLCISLTLKNQFRLAFSPGEAHSYVTTPRAPP